MTTSSPCGRGAGRRPSDSSARKPREVRRCQVSPRSERPADVLFFRHVVLVPFFLRGARRLPFLSAADRDARADALPPTLPVVHNKRAIAPNWHRARGGATPSLGGNLLLTSDSEAEEDDAASGGARERIPSSRFRGPPTPLFGGTGEVASLRARHRDAQPLTPTATAMAVVTTPLLERWRDETCAVSDGSEDDAAKPSPRDSAVRVGRSASSGLFSPAMASSRASHTTRNTLDFSTFSIRAASASPRPPGAPAGRARGDKSSPVADARGLGAPTSGSEPPSPIRPPARERLEVDDDARWKTKATRRDRAEARPPSTTREDETRETRETRARPDDTPRTDVEGDGGFPPLGTEGVARVEDFVFSNEASDSDDDASSDASGASLASASSVSFALEGGAAEAFARATEGETIRETRGEKVAAAADAEARGRVAPPAERRGGAPPPSSSVPKLPPPPPPQPQEGMLKAPPPPPPPQAQEGMLKAPPPPPPPPPGPPPSTPSLLQHLWKTQSPESAERVADVLDHRSPPSAVRRSRAPQTPA